MRILLGKNEKLVGYIDEIDADIVESTKIHAHRSRKEIFYMRCRVGKKKKRTYVHRIIIERITGAPLKPGFVVDHINENGLDNRRKNLRVLTNKENLIRRGPKPNTVSGLKGVWKSTGNKPWAAEIVAEGKKISLGYYATKEEAARVYDSHIENYFGPLAYKNFP